MDSMKKSYLVTIIIILIGLLLILAFKQPTVAPTVTDDDDVITEPVSDTDPNDEQRTTQRTGEAAQLVQVTSPQANNAITSPVTVSGEAPGYWYFEASAPVSIVNWDGLIIGEGYVTAQGDWMTEDQVAFTGTIEYDIDPATPYNRGWLILHRDNPSDLPQNDAAVEIPITFGELS